MFMLNIGTDVVKDNGTDMDLEMGLDTGPGHGHTKY
jgi:hypothetical protein